MAKKLSPEQHIAVFGESGSGKTVLISSFYGATQDDKYELKDLVTLRADNPGQHNKLYKNFLSMRDSREVPASDRFKPLVAYPFAIRDKLSKSPAGKEELLKLVWHDYPGEWWEQDVADEEASRAIDAFRALLRSDVAILLVDGQRLLENAGQEERYLKSLFSNFHAGLESRKDKILDGSARLDRFPRIWIVALSKADLLPNLDVHQFHDLILTKVCDEIDQLRGLIGEFISGPDALSVAEDFLLLSSAKFGENKIELDRRIGVDVVLPIAALVPMERYLKWFNSRQLPRTVAIQLLGNSQALLAFFSRLRPSDPKLAKVFTAVAPLLDSLARHAEKKLIEIHNDSQKKSDALTNLLKRLNDRITEAKNQRVFRSREG